jgi:hypothetical protein
MLKTTLVHPKDGFAAEIAHTPHGHVLMTTTPDKEHSYFKSATRTTDGTTIIVQPRSGEAISLTDLLISAAKVAGNLTIRFTDGTETVNLFIVPLTDAPVSFGVPFAGKWMGWRDARLEMVTSINGNAIVAVGYLKVPSEHTLSYAEWDAQR